MVPSEANFIFITHPRVPAVEISRKLREQGVLVRHFRKPRTENFLRVSIGSDQEMDVFLSAVKKIVEEAEA